MLVAALGLRCSFRPDARPDQAVRAATTAFLEADSTIQSPCERHLFNELGDAHYGNMEFVRKQTPSSRRPVCSCVTSLFLAATFEQQMPKPAPDATKPDLASYDSRVAANCRRMPPGGGIAGLHRGLAASLIAGVCFHVLPGVAAGGRATAHQACGRYRRTAACTSAHRIRDTNRAAGDLCFGARRYKGIDRRARGPITD